MQMTMKGSPTSVAVGVLTFNAAALQHLWLRIALMTS
jgi:hypothetical protein